MLNRAQLQYPVLLLQSTISDFVTAKVSGDLRSKQMCDEKKAPIRITLPFKREGHSKNRVFFSITNKKFTLSWITHRCFSFWNGCDPNEKEMKSLTPGTAILKGSWRSGRISMTSFCSRMCLFFWALVCLLLKPERASDSWDDNNQGKWNDRLENALWCTCERCATMLMQRECVCCRVGHQNERYILQYNCNGRS